MNLVSLQGMTLKIETVDAANKAYLVNGVPTYNADDSVADVLFNM